MEHSVYVCVSVERKHDVNTRTYTTTNVLYAYAEAP